MQENYELCLEVLKRLEKVSILKNVIIVGSWCLYFYKKHFFSGYDISSLRTGDVDFLVPVPIDFKEKIDVPELLKDLGFVVSYLDTKGHYCLEHPDLTVEFLVPERGKGMTKPYDLPQLGMNAQALRYLDYLSEETVLISVDNFSARFPHPIRFALHKLLIAPRRTKEVKREKDLNTALELLRFYDKQGDIREVKKRLSAMSQSWQKTIKKTLESAEEKELIENIF